jgi:hypothetical protein
MLVVFATSAGGPHRRLASLSLSATSKALMLRCSEASCALQPSSRPRTSAGGGEGQRKPYCAEACDASGGGVGPEGESGGAVSSAGSAVVQQHCRPASGQQRFPTRERVVKGGGDGAQRRGSGVAVRLHALPEALCATRHLRGTELSVRPSACNQATSPEPLHPGSGVLASPARSLYPPCSGHRRPSLHHCRPAPHLFKRCGVGFAAGERSEVCELLHRRTHAGPHHHVRPTYPCAPPSPLSTPDMPANQAPSFPHARPPPTCPNRVSAWSNCPMSALRASVSWKTLREICGPGPHDWRAAQGTAPGAPATATANLSQ